MEEFKNLLLFLTMFGVGALLEVVFAEGHYFFTKKHAGENHYTIRKYIFFLFFPALGFFLLIGRAGMDIIFYFFLFAILGTILEWVIGYSYHMIVGQRLWTYHRGDIRKYSSWLAVPIWGFIGLVFHLVTLMFN